MAGESSAKDIVVTPGLVMLAAANLFPIAGLFFLGWTGTSVIVLYFFEALVIYAVTARMLFLVDEERLPRYIFGYGAWLLILAGLWTLLLEGSLLGLLRVVSDHGLQVSAAIFVVSHLIAYWKDFIGKREYERLPANAVEGQMRTMFLALFVLPFLMGEIFYGGSEVVAAMLVMFKTIFSLRAYAKERMAAQGTDDEQQATAASQ